MKDFLIARTAFQWFLMVVCVLVIGLLDYVDYQHAEYGWMCVDTFAYSTLFIFCLWAAFHNTKKI